MAAQRNKNLKVEPGNRGKKPMETSMLLAQKTHGYGRQALIYNREAIEITRIYAMLSPVSSPRRSFNCKKDGESDGQHLP